MARRNSAPWCTHLQAAVNALGLHRAAQASEGKPVMSTTAQKAETFRALHAKPGSFLIANAWDAGSAKLFLRLGFPALATSSGAQAGVLGKVDGAATRDEALAHAKAIVVAVDLPVSADLEKCF